MAAVSICSDFGAPQNKVWHCFHCFPIYFPRSEGPLLCCKHLLSEFGFLCHGHMSPCSVTKIISIQWSKIHNVYDPIKTWLWYIHITGYYSVIKIKKLLINTKTWMNLKGIMLNERNQSKNLWVTPSIRHSWKSKRIMGNRTVVVRSYRWGGGDVILKRRAWRNFGDSGTLSFRLERALQSYSKTIWLSIEKT